MTPPLTFWSYDPTSRRAYVGRCREFATPGEARAYERGWYDGACGVAIETHISSYMTGFFDRESETLERFDDAGEFGDDDDAQEAA